MRTSLQLQLINLRLGLELLRESLSAHRGRVLAAVAAFVVLLTILASSAQAAPSFRSGSATAYYGLTSQDSPILIETSKDGRIVKRAIGALDLNCTADGAPFTMTVKDGWADVIVGLSRSFKQSYTDSDALPSGTTIEESSEFAGRFDRKRAAVKGTWRLQLVFHYSDGTTMSCESGVLHFSAQRMPA